MAYPRLVLNFHDYCFLHVPNGPEPANFGSICGPLESHVFTQHAQERANDATTQQPNGPSWLLTEFGATTDTADLARITSDAAANLVGWIYWQWIDYDDPTGSHSSALWPPRAATASQLNVLSETYPSAMAGTPTSTSFDPVTGAFELRLPLRPQDHRPHRDRRAGDHALSPRLLRPGLGGPDRVAPGSRPHRPRGPQGPHRGLGLGHRRPVLTTPTRRGGMVGPPLARRYDGQAIGRPRLSASSRGSRAP